MNIRQHVVSVFLPKSSINNKISISIYRSSHSQNKSHQFQLKDGLYPKKPTSSNFSSQNVLLLKLNELSSNRLTNNYLSNFHILRPNHIYTYQPSIQLYFQQIKGTFLSSKKKLFQLLQQYEKFKVLKKFLLQHGLTAFSGVTLTLSAIPYHETKDHPWSVGPTKVEPNIIPAGTKDYHYNVISKDKYDIYMEKKDEFSLFITYLLQKESILPEHGLLPHKFVHRWPKIPPWLEHDKDGNLINTYVLKRLQRYGIDIFTLAWCKDNIPQIFRFCNDEAATTKTLYLALSSQEWATILDYKTFVEKERFKLLRDFESGVDMQFQLVHLLNNALEMIEKQCTIPDDLLKIMKHKAGKRLYTLAKQKQELNQKQMKLKQQYRFSKIPLASNKEYLTEKKIIDDQLQQITITSSNIQDIPEFMIPIQIIPLYESLLSSLAHSCEIHTVYYALQDALSQYDGLIQEEYFRQKSLCDSNPQQEDLFFEPIQDLLTRQAQIIDASIKVSTKLNQQLHRKLCDFEHFLAPNKLRQYQKLLQEYRQIQLSLFTAQQSLPQHQIEELSQKRKKVLENLLTVNPLIKEQPIVQFKQDPALQSVSNKQTTQIISLTPHFSFNFFKIFSLVRQNMKTGTFFEPKSVPYQPFEHIPFHWDPTHPKQTQLSNISPIDRQNRFDLCQLLIKQIQEDRKEQLAPILAANREESRKGLDQSIQEQTFTNHETKFPLPNVPAHAIQPNMFDQNVSLYTSSVQEAKELLKKAQEQGLPDVIEKAEKMLKRRLEKLKESQLLQQRVQGGDVIMFDQLRLLTPQETEEQTKKTKEQYEEQKKKWEQSKTERYFTKDENTNEVILTDNKGKPLESNKKQQEPQTPPIDSAIWLPPQVERTLKRKKSKSSKNISDSLHDDSY